MEVIIFSGIPGSGKSTYYRQNFQETHQLISKDLMGKKNKPHKQRVQIEEALKAGKSIVVDNTNVSMGLRAEIIAFGKQYGAKIIGYEFESDDPTKCIQRNNKREGKALVPIGAIYRFFSEWEPMLYMEGFDEVYFVKVIDEEKFIYDTLLVLQYE